MKSCRQPTPIVKLSNGCGAILIVSKGSVVVGLIDGADIELCSKYHFTCNNGGYIQGTISAPTRKGIKHPQQLLHRILLKPGKNFQCDHISGDKLDNRRSNLRVATSSSNNMNRCKRSDLHNLTSKYKGVHWSTRCNKWHARIQIDGHSKHLGTFSDELTAAKAYDNAASLFFGNYSRTNNV